jgi:uncharacterized membrane protein
MDEPSQNNEDPSRKSEPSSDAAEESSSKIWSFSVLRKYLITGLVVAIPIGLTIYFAWSTIAFIDARVLRLIPAAYNPDTYLPYSIPGLGVVILLVALTLLGALTANFLGRRLITFGERIVDRMPIVRNIYNAIKQIMETVVSQSDTTFQEVCLIEYPRKGIYAIGFVTTDTKGQVQDIVSEDMVSVFLPTTPNPTSGFLLFVPKDDLKILDLSVEEGAKMVISAGLVVPENHEGAISRPAGGSGTVKKFLKKAEKAQRKMMGGK